MVYCALCKETITKIREGCRSDDDNYVAQCVEVKNSIGYHKHCAYKLSIDLTLPDEYVVCFRCLDKFEITAFYVSCDVCHKNYQCSEPTNTSENFNELSNVYDESAIDGEKNDIDTSICDNWGEWDESLCKGIIGEDTVTEKSVSECTIVENETYDNVSVNNSTSKDVVTNSAPVKTFKQVRQEIIQAEDPEYKYIFSDDEQEMPKDEHYSSWKEDEKLLRQHARYYADKCDATVLTSSICPGYHSYYDSDGNILFKTKRPENIPLGALICDECITTLIKEGTCRDPQGRYASVKCTCKICRTF